MKCKGESKIIKSGLLACIDWEPRRCARLINRQEMYRSIAMSRVTGI